MLPASFRLTKDADIKRVFAKGRGVFDEVCGLKYAKNGMKTSRFAIVVGIKISKKAVDRNKIKRRIRAILAKKIDLLLPGYDVVLLTRPQILSVGFSELESRIYKGLKKANLCAS